MARNAWKTVGRWNSLDQTKPITADIPESTDIGGINSK